MGRATRRYSRFGRQRSHHQRRLRLEPLEDRRLLSISLPGLHLIDTSVDRFDGQIIYLDVDGQEDVTYDGPVTVENIDVPAFSAPGELAGQEQAVITQVLDRLNNTFSETGLSFTTTRPSSGAEYSTVYIGGDDSLFAEYGSFLGLAETIDVANLNPADNAFVFSANLAWVVGNNASIEAAATHLSEVIAHESAHLVGWAHSGEVVDPTGLSHVALATPTLDTPSNGATGQSTMPLLSWSAVSRANSYRVLVATDISVLPTGDADPGSSSLINVNQVTADTSYTPLQDKLDDGETTYYWQVRADNTDTSERGYWSSPQQFTTAPITFLVVGIVDEEQVTFAAMINRIGSSQAITPGVQTWLIVHGRNGSFAGTAEENYMVNLAQKVASATGDQVLTLDWSRGAHGVNGPWWDFDGEANIKLVAQGAVAALSGLGGAGLVAGDLNLIGHSWGAYISTELAKLIEGDVNSVVALDPARDAPDDYNADNAPSFAANSENSWGFYSTSFSGNSKRAATAEEAFVVLNSGHAEVVSVFADMIVSDDPVSTNFNLSQLTNPELRDWDPNRFRSNGNPGSWSFPGEYEAVISADKDEDGYYAALLYFAESDNDVDPWKTFGELGNDVDLWKTKKNPRAAGKCILGLAHILYVVGTLGYDIVEVKEGSVIINMNGQQIARYPDEAFDPNENGVQRIAIFSDGGGYFDFRESPVPIIFYGDDDGDDIVYGSPFNDIIYGGGGSDFVRAGDGADTIYAIGGENNRLYGDGGDDVIYGSDGGDTLSGGAGSDTFTVYPSDTVVDETAEDRVVEPNERVIKRRQDRINSRQQQQQNVVNTQRPGIAGSADGTPEITEFTINSNVVTEGDSVIITVRSARQNWARLVLFEDVDGDGEYDSNIDTTFGQFRGRNQDWRGQIGTAKLGLGTHTIRAMLLPFSGEPAISAPIVLTVEEEVVLPEVPAMPDTIQIDPEDFLVLLPHRNGDAIVEGNTLHGDGQIDLWEITPRTGGGFRFWTEGSTDTVVALYDATGNRIGDWDSANGPGENGELLVTLNTDTTYYFAVASESGNGGAYDLHMTGRNQTTAGTITLSPATHVGELSGNFSTGHRLDFVKVVSPSDANLLDVSLDIDPGLDLWVRVADENNNLIGFGKIDGSGAEVILTDLPTEENTVYYITVYAMYGTEGDYTVTADFYPDESGFPSYLTPTPDADWLVPLPDGSLLVEGLSIDGPSEFDYYLLTPPGGSGSASYVIETSGTLDTRLGLYLRSGDPSSVFLQEDDDGGSGRNARLGVDLEQGYEYVLVVRSGNQETGDYGLSITSPASSIDTLEPQGLEATVSSGVRFISNNGRYHVFQAKVPTFASALDIDLTYYTSTQPDYHLDASIRVTNEAGEMVAFVDANGEEADESIDDLPVAPGGTYYITIGGEDLTIGQYILDLDFDPNYPVTSGNEFPVSTINAEHEWPDVDRNLNGQGVIVWTANNVPDGAFAHDEIRGLRIGADGQPSGSSFRIDQATEDNLGKPAVAVASNGSFLVAWGNKVRRFASNGSPLTNETSFTSQSVSNVAVDVDANGEFVVVWSTFSASDPDGGIYARRINASGSPVGSEIHVNSYTDEYQDTPDVAFLPNGDWVVTWVSNVATSGYDMDIRGRAFQGSSPVTAEFTVNTVTTGKQWAPAISASADGYGYVIVWTNASSTVSGRRYATTHTSLDDEFQATVTPGGTGVFDAPDVAMGSQGRFLVTAVASDGDGKGIIAQQFNPDSTASGPELILNQQTASDQDTPSVASNGDDKFLLAWRGPGSSTTDIFGLEYTLQDIQEPELAVEDDSEDPTDLAIDFGEFAPGDPTVSRRVTITNDGNADLTVTSLSIDGASAGLFALSDASDFVLAPGESRTLTVTFDPTVAGPATVSLTFDHNDTSDLVSGDIDPQPLSLSLSASVVPPPALEVTVLPDLIAENAGEDAAAVLVTRRNVDDISQSLSVSLTSSDESEAMVPETATIPADELSVVVFASAVDDYEDDGLQSVQISASAAGFATGSAELQVESVDDAPTLDPLVAVDDAYTVDENAVLTATAAMDTVVLAGATWKYLDDGTDQGAAWREPVFDDSTWQSGPAKLGYGEGDEVTEIGFGGDAGNKFVTTYFRRTFELSGVWEIDFLDVGLLRDDGAAVYLNGVEIVRTNLADDAAFDSLAYWSVGGDLEQKFFPFVIDVATLPPGTLVEGENVLAVEVHQAGVASSDLGFDLWLTARGTGPARLLENDVAAQGGGLTAVLVDGPTHGTLTINEDGSFEYVPDSDFFGFDSFTYLATDGQIQSEPATVAITVNAVPDALVAVDDAYVVDEDGVLTATAAMDTVVLAGATWKYLDDGTDQGTAWRQPAFDDLLWNSGAARLGYGWDGEVTEIGFGGDVGNKFVTTYFRRTFELSGVWEIDFLDVGLLRDDGAAVYLNGVEIVRTNLADDAAFDRLAYGAVGGDLEQKFFPFVIDVATLPPGTLVEGENVLAVEVHQATVASSDLGFDLWLTARGMGPARLLENDVAAQGGGLTAVLVDGPTHGTLTIDEDGSFEYVPHSDFFGFDSFTYFATDGQLQSEPATVAITVNAVPDAPVAVDDAYQLAENGVLVVDKPAVVAVPAGATWKYLDDGTDQGAAWREPVFDDSAWQSGPAELGYGEGDEATVIGFGGDAGNKFVTTYFRHTFEVDDLSNTSRIEVRLLRDDGAAVFLNGVELIRHNLSADAGFDDVATAVVGGLEESRLFFSLFDLSTLPEGILVEGANTLAVEVHQARPTSSDVSFDLELLLHDGEAEDVIGNDVDADLVGLTMVVETPPARGTLTTESDGTTTYTAEAGFVGTDTFTYFARSQQEITLVPLGAQWRYLDDGSDQGADWRTPGFDDTAWQLGAAELGYGDGDEATTIGFGDNPSAKYATTYFRKTFSLDYAADEISIELKRDDAAAIYLNGVEVYRDDNLAPNAASGTYATDVVDENGQSVGIRLPAVTLPQGDNTLAVEVHQAAPTSGDLSFDLELLGKPLSDAATVTLTVGDPTLTTVVARHVFYANSAFGDVSDDAAVAPDKRALLPGETATGANVTSYDRGINGIMIDIWNLLPGAKISAFEFEVGNGNDPDGWSTVDSQTAGLARGAGVDGLDRVTVTFADHAVENQWLRVTVKAGPLTGLVEDDVFYFGNAVGEMGNSETDTLVNAADVVAIRDNPRGELNPAGIDNPFDINRDARVDAVDLILARNNATSPLSGLRLIAPQAVSPAPLLSADAEGRMFSPTGEGESTFAAGSLARTGTPTLESLDDLMAAQADQPAVDSLLPSSILSKLLRRLGSALK